MSRRLRFIVLVWGVCSQGIDTCHYTTNSSRNIFSRRFSFIQGSRTRNLRRIHQVDVVMAHGPLFRISHSILHQAMSYFFGHNKRQLNLILFWTGTQHNFTSFNFMLIISWTSVYTPLLPIFHFLYHHICINSTSSFLPYPEQST